MGAIERAYYRVTCPRCGRTGIAKWWENDGPAFLRNPEGGVEAPAGFTQVSGQGHKWFLGERLVCTDCRVEAITGEEVLI